MAPPTAPAKTVDGGADDANLPVADVVVADETVPIAEEEPIAVAESVETIEPLAAATSTIESDAVLAQRLQREEEQGALLVRPGPPAGRVAVVESQYYGPVSFLASCLLFTMANVGLTEVLPVWLSTPVAPTPRQLGSSGLGLGPE